MRSMRKSSVKGKLILLTILVFLFGVFLFVKFFFLNKANELGEIKVLSTPKSSVFIDQIDVGKTPHQQKLKIGEYLIKLIPDKEATQTATWQGKIKVYKNSVTYIARELGSSDISTAGEISSLTKMESKPSRDDVGEVSVDSEPQGALVYLDLDEKGIAPLILADVPKGTHELSIYLPGFFRRTLKINVEPGYRTTSIVKLAIDELTQKESTKSAVKKVESDKSENPDATKTVLKVKIKDTPTGWLRVRTEPSVNASESAKVSPGEIYPVVEEQPNWFKILYNDEQEGWVASQYSEKVAE